MKLVKTTGGTNGAPALCSKCGNQHFAKSGIAWHCTNCGIYHPTELGFESLKQNLLRIQELHLKTKQMVKELEELVKE